MLKPLLFALASLAAFPALACPTIDDLGRGIEFRTANGDVEIHKQLRPDWMTLNVSFADGDGSLLEMYHGIYLLTVIPIEGGFPQPASRETYATVNELAQWDVPRPDATWENTTPGGGRAASGPLGTTMIAGCRYDSFEVVLQFNDDDTYKEVYTYLPELGVGLLVKTEASDRTDTYSYISVKAME